MEKDFPPPSSMDKGGLEFFGADHSLFATDAPFDPEGGTLLIRETINAVENLDIQPAERDKIYSGNLKRLLKIS